MPEKKRKRHTESLNSRETIEITENTATKEEIASLKKEMQVRDYSSTKREYTVLKLAL